MISSVTAMLSELGWTSLKQRRQNSRLIMFFKIVKELTPINLPHHYHQQELTYRTCQFHPLHSTINLDNKLPDELLPQNN